MPQIELSETIVRAGDPMPYSIRLAQPSRIRDLVIADGFDLRGVTAGKKAFGSDLVMIETPEGADREDPKFSLIGGYRILPQDDLRFDIVNASDEDRLFQGVLTYDLAPVVGRVLAPIRGAAPVADPPRTPAPTARSGATIPRNGSRALAAAPAAPAARASQAIPRSPGMLVGPLGHSRPTGAVARALRTVAPGSHQVVVLVNRRQAEVLERLARGDRHVSLMDRQGLAGSIARALGRPTIAEEDGPDPDLDADAGDDAVVIGSARDLGAS